MYKFASIQKVNCIAGEIEYTFTLKEASYEKILAPILNSLGFYDVESRGVSLHAKKKIETSDLRQKLWRVAYKQLEPLFSKTYSSPEKFNLETFKKEKKDINIKDLLVDGGDTKENPEFHSIYYFDVMLEYGDETKGSDAIILDKIWNEAKLQGGADYKTYPAEKVGDNLYAKTISIPCDDVFLATDLIKWTLANKPATLNKNTEYISSLGNEITRFKGKRMPKRRIAKSPKQMKEYILEKQPEYISGMMEFYDLSFPALLNTMNQLTSVNLEEENTKHPEQSYVNDHILHNYETEEIPHGRFTQLIKRDTGMLKAISSLEVAAWFKFRAKRLERLFYARHFNKEMNKEDVLNLLLKKQSNKDFVDQQVKSGMSKDAAEEKLLDNFLNEFDDDEKSVDSILNDYLNPEDIPNFGITKYTNDVLDTVFNKHVDEQHIKDTTGKDIDAKDIRDIGEKYSKMCELLTETGKYVDLMGYVNESIEANDASIFENAVKTVIPETSNVNKDALVSLFVSFFNKIKNLGVNYSDLKEVLNFNYILTAFKTKRGVSETGAKGDLDVIKDAVRDVLCDSLVNDNKNVTESNKEEYKKQAVSLARGIDTNFNASKYDKERLEEMATATVIDMPNLKEKTERLFTDVIENATEKWHPGFIDEPLERIQSKDEFYEALKDFKLNLQKIEDLFIDNNRGQELKNGKLDNLRTVDNEEATRVKNERAKVNFILQDEFHETYKHVVQNFSHWESYLDEMESKLKSNTFEYDPEEKYSTSDVNSFIDSIEPNISKDESDKTFNDIVESAKKYDKLSADAKSDLRQRFIIKISELKHKINDVLDGNTILAFIVDPDTKPEAIAKLRYYIGRMKGLGDLAKQINLLKESFVEKDLLGKDLDEYLYFSNLIDKEQEKLRKNPEMYNIVFNELSYLYTYINKKAKDSNEADRFKPLLDRLTIVLKTIFTKNKKRVDEKPKEKITKPSEKQNEEQENSPEVQEAITPEDLNDSGITDKVDFGEQTMQKQTQN